MTLTRRHLLSLAALAGAAQVLPFRVMAEIGLGAARLTTLSDGHLVLPGNMAFAGMPEAELAALLDLYGLSPAQVEPACNLTLYRDEARVVLFDVGSGPNFMPSAGKLPGSLEAAGIAPGDVTHVVFTHAHPDHIWGLLDEFDDPVFPEASYMMGRAEWDYWWDPATVDEIGPAREAFAVGAKRRMEGIEDRVILFDDGAEILPGIAAWATHGHTPGHMSFEIRQGGESVIVVGDAIANHHVAFHHPEWAGGMDQDPPRAAATRAGLMDRLAAEQLRMVGFHLPGGGIGRVETAADGYRFVPEAG